MNVLVIGGSNSRLKDGYTATLFEKLQIAGLTCHINNISLGANTCLLGLISLLDLNYGVNYDLVLIEYSVNDYSMTTRGDNLLWRASYEGLIRCVYKKYPSAKVCCILLGRSNPNPNVWNRQICETKLIANNYPNNIIADVQGNIPSLLGKDKLFSDPLHYSKDGQAAAGNFIAARILENINKKNYSLLPEPFYAQPLDNVGIVQLRKVCTSRQIEEGYG